MKKVVRKKKGVTLIAVLMVTAIISTVVTAMLGMISTSYKARNLESKKLQNMYTSDSALDVVYNIINRTSRAAIIKAINDDDVKNEKDETTQNNLFKQKFISNLINGVDISNETSKIVNSIRDWTFPIYNEDGTISYEKIDDKDVELKVMDLDEINNISSKDKITGEEQIKIRVQSTFKTKDSDFKNTKVLEANYIVSAPEYKEIQIEKSVDIYTNPVYTDKVITTDGDLNATGVITLNGDIWAKGTKESFSKNDKYTGGIIFNNADVTVNSNIYTSNTLTINNDSTVNFDGDIYSSNTYISEDVNKAANTETELIAAEDSEKGKLVTFNDLVLNAAKGNVTLKTYFGINDISNGNTTSINADLNLAENKSSSIIVNNLNSKLQIDGDAYIRGVAYLDNNISEEYKTGESIAVKGNYVAYTDPSGNENVTMKYYSPLQLIEYINGTKFDLAEKEDHFVKYYKDKDVNTADGIYLNGNVYSAGAIVKKDDITNASIAEGSTNNNLTDIQIDSNVNEEKYEFASNVLAMGDVYGIGTKKSLYDEWVNNGLVEKTNGRTVATQINFDKIDGQDTNDFFGKLILNNEKDKKITISEGKITIGSKSIELDKSDMRALIVTNGDVEFIGGKEDLNFTGNIITTKNVTIKGAEGNINLNYDEDVTTKIYASNKDYLDTIFKKFSNNVVNISLVDALSGTISDYDENEYLRKGQWKIIE